MARIAYGMKYFSQITNQMEVMGLPLICKKSLPNSVICFWKESVDLIGMPEKSGLPMYIHKYLHKYNGHTASSIATQIRKLAEIPLKI